MLFLDISLFDGGLAVLINALLIYNFHVTEYCSSFSFDFSIVLSKVVFNGLLT